MVTVQELFNAMPLWRVAHLLDFESAQVVCEFCMTRPSESIGRNGRRMRRQAGRMGFAAVFIDLGF